MMVGELAAIHTPDASASVGTTIMMIVVQLAAIQPTTASVCAGATRVMAVGKLAAAPGSVQLLLTYRL